MQSRPFSRHDSRRKKCGENFANGMSEPTWTPGFEEIVNIWREIRPKHPHWSIWWRLVSSLQWRRSISIRRNHQSLLPLRSFTSQRMQRSNLSGAISVPNLSLRRCKRKSLFQSVSGSIKRTPTTKLLSWSRRRQKIKLKSSTTYPSHRGLKLIQRLLYRRKSSYFRTRSRLDCQLCQGMDKCRQARLQGWRPLACHHRLLFGNLLLAYNCGAKVLGQRS